MTRATPESGLLVEAVKARDVERVRQLLAEGADPNEMDRRGTPGLVYAAIGDLPAIAELLIAHGADINECERDGITPLMYAARDSLDVLNLLIEAGADLEKTDFGGNDAMRWARDLNCDKAVDILWHAPERQQRVAEEKAALAARKKHPHVVSTRRRRHLKNLPRGALRPKT